MRFVIIIILVVCILCVALDQGIASRHLGSSGRPVCTQPSVTEAELAAAHAQRAERLRVAGVCDDF